MSRGWRGDAAIMKQFVSTITELSHVPEMRHNTLINHKKFKLIKQLMAVRQLQQQVTIQQQVAPVGPRYVIIQMRNQTTVGVS